MYFWFKSNFCKRAASSDLHQTRTDNTLRVIDSQAMSGEKTKATTKAAANTAVSDATANASNAGGT